MNREQLSDAIGRLDESIIEETMAVRRRRPWWYAAVAVAACVALAVGMVTVWPQMKPQGVKPSMSMGDGTTIAPTETVTTAEKPTVKPTTKPIIVEPPSATPLSLLAQPQYPTITARPHNSATMNNRDAWRADVKAQQDQIKGQTGGMTDYYAETIAQFLAGKAGENRVYSPLNVYLALAMLAETADGNSRHQILNLLGVSDLTTLRQKCSALWNGVYMDDGAVTSLLANSLWLAEGERWQYDMDTVGMLAEQYYASVFQGEMGSDAYTAALQNWLNEQTDNLLNEQVQTLGFDPDTVLALASTICFRAKWQSKFNPLANEQGVFNTVMGEVPCTYMKSGKMNDAYFGENFTAVPLELDHGDYEMIFFLPNEGVSVDSLITDKQALAVMQGRTGSVDSKHIKVNMSIPKFDVVSDQDLIGGLKALGITDVFNPDKGNFAGILNPQRESVWVNQVQHAARVAIDEEGVTAVAYVIETKAGSPMPNEILDFTVDRPFMFAITGPEDTILFTGVVENP